MKLDHCMSRALQVIKVYYLLLPWCPNYRLTSTLVMAGSDLQRVKQHCIHAWSLVMMTMSFSIILYSFLAHCRFHFQPMIAGMRTLVQAGRDFCINHTRHCIQSNAWQ